MNTIKKWLPSIIAFVVAGVLGLQIIFYFYGDVILKKSLLVAFSRYVKFSYPQARHLPHLDFKTLSVNLIRGDMEVSDVVFEMSGPLDQDSVYKNVHLEIPQLTLEGLSVWEIYWQKEIDITSVRLAAPSLSLLKGDPNRQKVSSGKTTSLKQQVARVFENRLDKVTIGQILVEGGHVEYSRINGSVLEKDVYQKPGQQIVSKIDMEVNQIYLDYQVLQDSSDHYLSKSFRLDMEDYHALLPDSSYRLNLDRLSYSSTDEMLILRKFSVRPFDPEKNKGKDQVFEVSIPAIEISEVVPMRLLRKNAIELNTITVHDPEMTISANFDRRDSTHISKLGLRKFTTDSLARMAIGPLKSFLVESISIKNGSLSILNINDQQDQLLAASELSVDIHQFSIDHTESQSDKLLPIGAINMDASNLQLSTPDKLHTIQSRKLHVSSENANVNLYNVSLDSIKVIPITDSLTGLMTKTNKPANIGYEILVNRASLFALDINQLTQNKAVVLDSIKVVKPEITLANFTKVPFGELISQRNQSDTAQNKSLKEILYDWSHARLDLHPIIAPGKPTALFSSLAIDKIQLENGRLYFDRSDPKRFRLQRVGALEKFSAEIENLSINNQSLIGGKNDHRVAIGAENFMLMANHGLVQLPDDKGPTSGGKVRFHEVQFSTRGQSGYVTRLHIIPDIRSTDDSRTQLNDLYIPYAEVSGVDFRQFYHAQFGNIEQFIIRKPQLSFYIDEYKPVKENISRDLSVKNLFQWIKPYLNQVFLKNFQIQNADLEIKKKKVGSQTYKAFMDVNSFNLQVDNFYIDSLEQISHGKPLYTRDIAVLAADFTISIQPDSLREHPVIVRGDTAQFSLRNKTLEVLGVTVKSGEDNAQLDYRLSVGETKLAVNSFYDYFMTDHLTLDAVDIDHPEFKLTKLRPSKDNKSKGGFQELQPNLHPYLNEFAKSVNVSQLRFNEGKVDILSAVNDSSFYLAVDTINLQARDILVDELSNSKENLGYAANLDFQFHIADGIFKTPQHTTIRLSDASLYSSEKNVQATLEVKNEADSTQFLERFNSCLTLYNVNYAEIFLDGVIALDSVTFHQPKLFANLAPSQTKSFPTPPKMISGDDQFFHKVSIEQIKGEEGAIFLAKESDTTVVSNLSVQLDDFFISVDDQENDRFANSNHLIRQALHADNMQLELHDFRHESDYNQFEIEDLFINARDGVMELGGVRFAPQVRRSGLSSFYPYQKTWVDVRVPEVVFSDVNIQRLVNGSALEVGRVDAVGMHMDLYKNKTLEIDSVREKPMLRELLQQLSFPFLLDSLKISDSFIAYEEQVSEDGQSGKITFEDFNMSGSNVTNINDKNHSLWLDANASLLGLTPLQLQMNFFLTSPEHLFTAKGTMGKMDLRSLNTILLPTASIMVNKGTLEKMDFELTGNQYQTSGMMHCYYNHLNVMLTDKRNRRMGIDERVGTFFANTFVLRASNPVNNSFRIGKIDYDRDQTKSISYYLWKSLLSGLKSSIGLEKKADKTKFLMERE